MDRLEMYYRWLTMRVYVRNRGHSIEVEAERADGSSSVKICLSLEEAKAYVAELRKEGNREKCQR